MLIVLADTPIDALVRRDPGTVADRLSPAATQLVGVELRVLQHVDITATRPEVLSILAFVATIIFLARRNMLKVQRFWKPEMKGWPRLDGNLILIFEIILLIGTGKPSRYAGESTSWP